MQETHKTLFMPPLPQLKAAAIDRLGYGYNEKIFVEFDRGTGQPVDEVPAVAYQLLWDVEWPGCKIRSPSSCKQESLPAWAAGIYSFR